MKFRREHPSAANRRRSAGWWMDEQGTWRPPEEWPYPTPPRDGWLRGFDGAWRPADEQIDPDEEVADGEPAEEEPAELTDHGPGAVAVMARAPVRTSRADRDTRSMLLIAGAVAGVLLLLVVALVLITQAGAADDAASTTTAPPIFAAETAADIEARRAEVLDSSPATARARLDGLPQYERAPAEVTFAAGDWTPRPSDCLTTAERVLVARSGLEISWADEAECELDDGRWDDRYLGQRLVRAVDADVVHHVPTVEAHRSGGWRWDAATRVGYLQDLAHPATLQIVAADSGHNPRGVAPHRWRPAAETTWCAYAIDWIAVKHRWELGVVPPERDALTEMLDTCEQPTSAGPDAATVPLDEPTAPTIVLAVDPA